MHRQWRRPVGELGVGFRLIVVSNAAQRRTYNGKGELIIKTKLKERAWGCPVARPTSSPLLGEGRGLAQLLLLLVIRKRRPLATGGAEAEEEESVRTRLESVPTANTRTPRRSFRFKQRPRSNRQDPFSRRHLSLSLSLSGHHHSTHKKENKP